jgi:hypothetical protein
MNKKRIVQIQKTKVTHWILLQAMMRYAYFPNSKADAVCFKTTITQSLSASRIKMILMNQMMKMNMMITKKMTRWTASSTHLCSQALIKM